MYCLVAGECDVQIFPIWILPPFVCLTGLKDVGVMRNLLAKNPHEEYI
jgi:hypothetical protein